MKDSVISIEGTDERQFYPRPLPRQYPFPYFSPLPPSFYYLYFPIYPYYSYRAPYGY
ncbi:hypothetical protein [Ammoniphilus sp. 3BR4]|uniref:hypothetical protein n=1 Tax=Ammoniphilus sp. 3BR4 TaxID=3158265 RepID=UPI0034659BFD